MAFLFWPLTLLMECVRFAIGTLVLASCLLTVAALFLGNNSWLWNLTTHFRVQYLWIQGIALALATWDFFRKPASKQAVSFFSPAILTRWINLVLLMVCAGLNLCFIAPLYRHSSIISSTQKSTKLRWLHINILGKYNHRTEEFISLLRTIHPDVLDLMEYTPAWNLRLERSGILKRYPYRYVVPYHIALYSRYPILQPQLRFPPGYRNIPNQGYITARLRLPATSLSVILAHPASPMNEQRWKWHSTLLKYWTYHPNQMPQPLVLVGDLNATPWAPNFIDLLSKTGLRDSQEGFGPQPSWPSFWPPLDPSLKTPFWLAPLGLPIDHILVSPGIYVSDRHVGPFIGSDHRPVWADLRISAPIVEKKRFKP